jgi:hypothetical protein
MDWECDWGRQGKILNSGWENVLRITYDTKLDLWVTDCEYWKWMCLRILSNSGLRY